MQKKYLTSHVVEKQNVRDTGYRSDIHLSDREIEYHLAESLMDLLQSFHLVYQNYKKCDFTAQCRSSLLFTVRDLLETSFTVIACEKDTGNKLGFGNKRKFKSISSLTTKQILATLTTISGSISCLPSYNAYRDCLTGRGFENKLVAEGTKFAVKMGISRHMPFLSREMVKKVAEFWILAGINDVFVVVHPKHQRFWQRTLKFKALSEVRRCERVGGNPGVLLYRGSPSRSSRDLIPLQRLQHNSSELSEQVYENRLHNLKSFSLSLEQIVLLLLIEPEALENANDNEIKLLIKRHPELKAIVQNIKLRNRIGGTIAGKSNFALVDIKSLFEEMLLAIRYLASLKGLEIDVRAFKVPGNKLVCDWYRLYQFVVELFMLLIHKDVDFIRIYISTQFSRVGVNEGESCLSVRLLVGSTQLKLSDFLKLEGHIPTQSGQFEKLIMGQHARINQERQAGRMKFRPLGLQGGIFAIKEKKQNNTFELSFNLPTCISYSKKLIEDSNPALENTNLDRPLALVVSSSKLEQRIMALILKRCKIHAVTCDNADSALTEVYHRNYELMIFSTHIKGMNGYQLSYAVRHFERELLRIPTLIIGVLFGRNTVNTNNALLAGINDSIVNVLNLQELIGTLAQCMRDQIKRLGCVAKDKAGSETQNQVIYST